MPSFFFQFPQRHAVLFEEADQVLARDAAVLAAGDAVAAEPAGIKPFTHRTGCDLTDFRHLAGGKNFLHGRHSNLCFLSPLLEAKRARSSRSRSPQPVATSES